MSCERTAHGRGVPLQDFSWYFRLVNAAAEHAAIDLTSVTAPATLLAGRWDMLTAWDEVVAAAGRLPEAMRTFAPGDATGETGRL